jgi:histidinol phosphatase-like enzyme
MRAVFVHKRCVLRDSHIEPDASPESWRLVPASLEAMRLLSADDTLVFLYGLVHETSDQPETGQVRAYDQEALVDQVEAGGGRVDAILECPHGEGDLCKCWGEFPGMFWVAASQFGLDLDECYVLCDDERDVVTAYAAGARPLVVLCARSIGEVFGNLPDHKDFPVATDLTTAVNYIGVEEGIAGQLGHPRASAPPVPTEATLYASPDALPTLSITSRMAHALRARLVGSRAQLRDIGRWLTFFVLGALGLSLGIAYLLTHLYRVQPFPEFVYYLTLQFIPRPLRGAFFIAWGIGVLVLAVRSFYRSASMWRKPPT